jgi:hypothetical protein
MRLAPLTRGDDVIIGVSLVLAPVFLFLSTLVLPPLKSDTAVQLETIRANHERYYAFIALGIVASTFFLPALFGLMQIVRCHRARLGVVGGLLGLAAMSLSLVDYGSELMKWQAGVSTASPTEMTALVKRFDGSAGASIPLQLSGILALIAFALLAVGLNRGVGRSIWLSLGVMTGIFLSLAGFAFSSVAILDIGALLLIATLGWVGRGLIIGNGENAAASTLMTPTVSTEHSAG